MTRPRRSTVNFTTCNVTAYLKGRTEERIIHYESLVWTTAGTNAWKKLKGCWEIKVYHGNLKERCSARVLPRHTCTTMALTEKQPETEQVCVNNWVRRIGEWRELICET